MQPFRDMDFNFLDKLVRRSEVLVDILLKLSILSLSKRCNVSAKNKIVSAQTVGIAIIWQIPPTDEITD